MMLAGPGDEKRLKGEGQRSRTYLKKVFWCKLGVGCLE